MDWKKWSSHFPGKRPQIVCGSERVMYDNVVVVVVVDDAQDENVAGDDVEDDDV